MARVCTEKPYEEEAWCFEHCRGAWELRAPLHDRKLEVSELVAEQNRGLAELIASGGTPQYPSGDQKIPEELAMLHGTAGEVGARARLGGELLGRGKSHDVRLDCGHFEIKTSLSVKRPTVNVRRRFFPRSDLILCVSPWNDAYDVRVLAWIRLANFKESCVDRGFGWSLAWKPTLPWRRIEELL